MPGHNAAQLAMWMDEAIAIGAEVRRRTPPNPWVGAVLVCADGRRFTGATEPPGGRHAEIVALDAARAAGAVTAGSTMVVTLEPCCHTGRTGPCSQALIDAGVATVTAAIEDPDPQVAGGGLTQLRSAGVEVVLGIGSAAAARSLSPYLHHRRTGRPLVVLKMAATLDGRTAAADGSSQWITGPAARAAVHQLRADSDAVLVGAGTVRADDPALTVRHVEGEDPRRVVLGRADSKAAVHPCWEMSGELPVVLAELGRRGVLQLLVEGGAQVAGDFHRAGLVDRYVLHLAPALSGGADGRGLFDGPGASTMEAMWRGTIVSTRRLGDDLEVVVEPRPSGALA